MSTANNEIYKLNFIGDNNFEILCINKGETLAIKYLIESEDFITDVLMTTELDPNYPDKLTGITSNKEGLINLLKEWDKLMDEQEVTSYKDTN